MWHRLPLEKNALRPASRGRSWAVRLPRGDRPGPRGCRDSRRKTERDSVRLGQRVRRARRRGSGVRGRRLRRHQPRLPGVRARGRLRPRRSLVGRGLALEDRDRRPAPAVLGAAGRRVDVAGHVRVRSASAGLARVRQPRGGFGVRPLAGVAPHDRGRVSSRRVRHSRQARSARIPGGRRARTGPAGTSTSRAGTPCRWVRIRPVGAPGEFTTCSATAGSGRRLSSRPSRVSSPWRPIPSTPPTSSTGSTG